MSEEYYHKDLFGLVVDLGLAEEALEDESEMEGLHGEFNIWSFTDALGARDKKRAWLLYRKALAAGFVPEEVFYKAVWQVKTMLLAKRCSSAAEAGLKPFPYSKAKGFLRNWKEGELEKFSERLVMSYHEARRGEGEIETSLEKAILCL